jgi:hypothetical protein
VDSNNRESITSIETIYADGSGIPLIIIFIMQTYLQGSFLLQVLAAGLADSA